MDNPGNFDSLNDVETDNRISLQFSVQEGTRDTERRFAGTKQDFRLDNVRRFPDNLQKRVVIEQQQRPELYQCSSQRDDDLGSGSDSAIEEDSPYGSFELPKNEALVPSGTDFEISKIRIAPQIQDPSGIYPATQCFPTPTPTTQNDPNAKQIHVVAEESTVNFGQGGSIVPTGSRKDIPKLRKNQYENPDVRLATFLKYHHEWPHREPSAEKMATAGMIYIGVVHMKERNETVYDMVECYKCGKRMYAFKETDDPKAEHKKIYPNCL